MSLPGRSTPGCRAGRGGADRRCRDLPATGGRADWSRSSGIYGGVVARTRSSGTTAAPRRWGSRSALSDEDDARTRLIEATTRCIVRRGNADIRMAEVADEAFVTRSTLYRYFASREELLQHVLVH